MVPDGSRWFQVVPGGCGIVNALTLNNPSFRSDTKYNFLLENLQSLKLLAYFVFQSTFKQNKIKQL
jgi:hypothetical protein